VLRRLLSPRWLGALVLAGLFAVASYHLGWWQYHRYESKVARNAQLDRNYAASPVPVTSVLTPAGFRAGTGWTRVTATGRYVAGPIFARARPNDGATGMEALWAFRPAGGGPDVLVDRGWVPLSARGASELPDVAPAPTGQVTVVGWLRPSEESRDKAPTPGTIANLSVSDAAAALGTPLLPGYVLLQQETGPDGSTPPRPQALEPPDRDLGPHQAYAYQWWLFMAAGFVLVGVGVRREEHLAHPEKYPPKEKKVRIWDEEDE
jgi:cytochrome oxidase assembly protein ShyY1